MERAPQVRRALLYLAAALLSALFSDWVIEGSANVGFFGRSYAEHDHRSVICTAAVAIGLLFLAILSSVLEKVAILGSDGDWIEEAARDISSRWSWRALGASYAVAIAARYAMESARQLEQSGNIAQGWDWLGGPLVVALVIHAGICVLSCLGLFVLMRAVDRTLERVVSLVFTLITGYYSTTHDVGRHVDRLRAVIYRKKCALARHLGERGPPLLHGFRSSF